MQFAIRGRWVAGLAVCLMALPALGDTRYSEVGGTGKKQVWLKAGDFVGRSQDGGSPNFELDPDATAPKSGEAYYFRGSGAPTDRDANQGSPGVWTWPGGAVGTEQMPWWAQYEILPADLPVAWGADGGLTGTWYFWARVQQDTVAGESSYEWNVDSDWLLVNGDPADLNVSGPQESDWQTAITTTLTQTPAADRILNDVHGAGEGVRPNWRWVSFTPSTRRSKVFPATLIDGKVTWRIYEAEAGYWNARIDLICWSNDTNFVPTDADFDASLSVHDCPVQHETATVAPASHSNTSDVNLTITGASLDLVTEVRLVPNFPGGVDIVGTNVQRNVDNTQITADFAITGAHWGMYNVRTAQLSPCATKTLTNSFEVICSTPTTFASISPSTLANPNGPVQLTIKGTNVTQLTGVELEYANVDDDNHPVLTGTALTPNGDDLLVTFDFTCKPAGPYILNMTRDANDCPNPANVPNAVWVIKPPPGGVACKWQPWASGWSDVLTGDDLHPPDLVYNPPNWDYTFSQVTMLNLPKDTPTGGGATALHFFWDKQPTPEIPSPGFSGGGSGGVYQEIPVTPGVPLQYSYWWKGAGSGDTPKWFELLLLDGPFNLYYADGYQESKRGQNNPYMVRKTSLTGDSSFGWTEVTHLTPADPGDYGPRPQTITPTRDVVTVVLKAGSLPGRMEVFFDNIVVQQAGGPNLMVNGGFESSTEKPICDSEWMFKDPCESNFWRRSPFTPIPCPVPFANTDGDDDVDMDDFGAFQRCITGPDYGPVNAGCECFDRPEPNAPDGNIDQVDLAAFIRCISGPDIPLNPNCADLPPEP